MTTEPQKHHSSFKHIFLVLSGKGGVGKSTVASQLALTLAESGKKVGLLDADLCGPSVARLFNVETEKVKMSTNGWVPIRPGGDLDIQLMSTAFLLNRKEDPVVWRGPKKTMIIGKFLNDTYWGDLDFLIVDTPPGTSDEHISVIKALEKYKPDGAIIVTTPQFVALSDVMKEISFCNTVNLPIMGLIENMSGFVCPTCEECTNIFGRGGGKALADNRGIPFLGAVPIDPKLSQCLDEGQSFIEAHKSSNALVAIKQFVSELIDDDESE